MQRPLDLPWQMGGLSRDELLALLRRPIPKAEHVAPNTTLVDVIEQTSGRRLFWMRFGPDSENRSNAFLQKERYVDFTREVWDPSKYPAPTLGDLLIWTLDTLVFDHGLKPRCQSLGEPRYEVYLAFTERTIQLVPIAIRECGSGDEDIEPSYETSDEVPSAESTQTR